MPDSMSFCVHEEVSSSGPVLKANLIEALVCSGYAPRLHILFWGDASNNLYEMKNNDILASTL